MELLKKREIKEQPNTDLNEKPKGKCGFQRFLGLRLIVATPPIRLRRLTENLKYWINELAPCRIESSSLLIPHYTYTNRQTV